ncbi:MAG TPA: sigma-70 family RNA polymerase sigma factor, partial [Polyangiaceae bacterium]|nr:sigma-70 family RNA polymerase sigma factor [Polyangiaceae bacterium]
MSEASANRVQQQLGAAETRRFLRDYIKRRVSEADVDDVVQTVLVEALASSRVPDGETDLKKWLIGVARHKIADLHRRAGREQPSELGDVETVPAPVEERELIRWAEEQAKGSKDAEKTLDWMAREGEGDKLEHIAEEEKLPAATVRQRVSRMRRWMKERWLAELAAVAALSLLAFVIWRFFLQPKPEIAVPEPEVPTTTP